MKQFTKAQYQRLLRNGDLARRRNEPFPVVKLFTTSANAAWLVTEIDPSAPDMAFGLCDLGLGFPELGYINLFELTSLGNHFKSPVKQDLAFKAVYPISVYVQAAKMAGKITEEPAALHLANAILKAD